MRFLCCSYTCGISALHECLSSHLLISEARRRHSSSQRPPAALLQFVCKHAQQGHSKKVSSLFATLKTKLEPVASFRVPLSSHDGTIWLLALALSSHIFLFDPEAVRTVVRKEMTSTSSNHSVILFKSCALRC